MRVHNNSHTIKRLPLSIREKINDNKNQKRVSCLPFLVFLEFKQAEKTQQHEYLVDTLRMEGLPSVANYYAQALDDRRCLHWLNRQFYLCQASRRDEGRIDASYLDWRNMVIKMQNAIKNRPQNEKCTLVVSFWKERVKIMSQTYQRMVFSSLVCFQVFGKEYKKVTVHIVSE